MTVLAAPAQSRAGDLPASLLPHGQAAVTPLNAWSKVSVGARAAALRPGQDQTSSSTGVCNSRFTSARNVADTDPSITRWSEPRVIFMRWPTLI